MARQTLLGWARDWLLRTFTLKDPESVEVFGPPRARAGVRVSQATAMTYAAVHNAVTIYAQTVASLPLHVYRTRPDGGKERASEHPLYRVLHDRPNPLMDSYRWREVMMVYLLLWGNFYAEVVEREGFEEELWPIPPWRAAPRLLPSGRDVVYDVTLPSGGMVTLDRSRVFHVAGLGFDGFLGKSVISLARESLGLGMAAEAFGAQFFGSGANLSGVLEHPGTLSETAQENIRRQWRELYSGLDNSHRVAVLEEGMKFARIGIPPEDAQFLQTREHQIEEVARWFNLPPHMLKDLRRSTFSNIEHQALEFVKYSLLPWLRRIEAAIKHQLLAGRDEADLFAEFVVEGLLRGDTDSRYRAYATARQWGWLSANDIRRLENMDPIDGGDIYLQPLNMVPAGTVLTPEADSARAMLPDLAECRSMQGRRRLRDAYRPIIEEAAGRIVRREVAEIRRRARRIWAQRDRQQWEEFLERFYADFEPIIARTMAPALRSLAEQAHAEAMDEIGSDEEMGPEYEQFVDDYTATFARRWRGSSEGQLRQIVQDEPEDPLPAIEERLDEWALSRAAKVGRREAIRAGEAFAKATWTQAGVVTVRWEVVGETCPFCDQLGGRVAGVQSAFVQKGQTITAPGASPLTSFSSIGHPPLHDGCDCMIVPVIGLRKGDPVDAKAVLRAILEQALEEEIVCPCHAM